MKKKGNKMLKNRFIYLGMLGLMSISPLSAYTLQESVKETLNTNPTVQESLKNFRATQQDLNIAKSEYYPEVDLSASVGYNNAGKIKTEDKSEYNHAVNDVIYNDYKSSLIFTQNLFNGFSTVHKVDFEKAKVLASAYKYLEKSNDAAFQMTKAYINVLKTKELVGTAKENVQINEDIYNKVKDLFEAGLTTDSEVKKIQSTLSLARSNLTVQKNNALDAEYTYRRVLGRLPEVSELEKPKVDVKMPESIEKAALYAIENNPSLLVSRYNILGAKSLWSQQKKNYYPKIDLEISQSFNDNNEIGNGFDQPDDRFKARLALTYNLFRGGADKASVQKHVSKMNQEVEIQRDLKRQVIEGLDLSWSAYSMIEKQLKDLKEYSKFSEKTLELYKEEYDLGRRSLLDLLSAQNDVINSRSQIITAEYDYLFAKYRILDAMGLLVVAVNGSADEFTSKVNLYVDEAAAKEVLDTMIIDPDLDQDTIAENVDLCDNSLKGTDTAPYGCKRAKVAQIKAPVKTAVVEVQEKDSDSDGIADSIDSCPVTPVGYGVDSKGCANFVTMEVNFQKDSTKLPANLDKKIAEFAKYMRAYPNVKAKIVGHTSRTKVSNALYNLKLSKARASRVKQELINSGIEAMRLQSSGKGFEQPIADNSTEAGRIKNRRVEIELFR
jgi:outer membrane protein, adhesin transport system